MATTEEKNRFVGTKGGRQGLAAHEYWTPERRAAAKPLPLPGPGEVEAAAHGAEPGLLPPGRLRSERESGTPETIFRPGGNPVADPRSYPYSTCGKLFVTFGGQDLWASAAVVGSKNVILTAGHAVYDRRTGSWASNVRFFPQYPLVNPRWNFWGNYMAVNTKYTDTTGRHYDHAFDYGMIWSDENPGDGVGWLGLIWNASTSGRTWDAVAYPALPNPPFDGHTMCEARGTAAQVLWYGYTDERSITLDNDNMEGGSSGGPWITDYNGAYEYANGLQGQAVVDDYHIFWTYGPYFTEEVKNLFDWISDPANRQ